MDTTRKPRVWIAAALIVCLLLAAVGIAAVAGRRDKPVMTSGAFSLDNTELAYYYWSEYFYYAEAFGTYLDGVVDFTQPLDTQTYSEDMTWQDYLLEETLGVVRDTKAMVFRAEEEGFQLPADYAETYDAVLESFRTTAEDQGYEDLSAYLRASYGEDAAEESFSAYLYDSHLAAAYADSLMDAISLSDETVRDYYESHAGEYLESYGVTREDKNMPGGVVLAFESWGEAQAVYEKFLSAGADLQSLCDLGAASLGETGLLHEIQPGQQPALVEAWFYDDARQVGDHQVISEEDGCAEIVYYSDAGDRPYWYILAEEDLLHETYQNQYLQIIDSYTFLVDYDAVRLSPPEGLYDTEE